ncbi:hypothetical protein C7401_103327 [Paraburkholderia unamae]|uniref:DUF5672 family protein n=1 Tax=Paraburkholderia unamae TaxID=219649 RepID=UPI000DC265F9|nr:DUF5672 family protein [Paraburkholderia unamae]RAR66020.1 hypothetical protein C7401_103327 [Paraburkholderia unamae]
MQTNANPPVDLRNVTLCAVDTINAGLAARALDISMAQCAFGDAILFTDASVPTQARIVSIDRLRSREAYSTFLLKQLAQHIATPWVLVVQWDGYVLDGARWSDRFLDYDYIGAHWPHRNDGMSVGNGGFSLRSLRLLRALADDRFAIPESPVEDDLICRTWRPMLEAEYGIRFAPVDVAKRFSYEGDPPGRPTFGFHAVFNMWRHVDDTVLMNILREIDIRTFAANEMLFLLVAFWQQGKFACVKSMYARYRSHWSAEEFIGALVKKGVDESAARRFQAICENA